jgi:hypothetical protein
MLFGTMFALLALIAWRALAAPDSVLYFIAAFFAVAAEATWSATFLSTETLGRGIALYVAFGVFYLGVPMLARRSRPETRAGVGRGRGPDCAASRCCCSSPLVCTAGGAVGTRAAPAIPRCGSVSGKRLGRPAALSAVGGCLSWVVLAVWWGESAARVGCCRLCSWSRV